MAEYADLFYYDTVPTQINVSGSVVGNDFEYSFGYPMHFISNLGKRFSIYVTYSEEESQEEEKKLNLTGIGKLMFIGGNRKLEFVDL